VQVQLHHARWHFGLLLGARQKAKRASALLCPGQPAWKLYPVAVVESPRAQFELKSPKRRLPDEMYHIIESLAIHINIRSKDPSASSSFQG
jgi:hypothetical protein